MGWGGGASCREACGVRSGGGTARASAPVGGMRCLGVALVLCAFSNASLGTPVSVTASWGDKPGLGGSDQGLGSPASEGGVDTPAAVRAKEGDATRATAGAGRVSSDASSVQPTGAGLTEHAESSIDGSVHEIGAQAEQGKVAAGGDGGQKLASADSGTPSKLMEHEGEVEAKQGDAAANPANAEMVKGDSSPAPPAKVEVVEQKEPIQGSVGEAAAQAQQASKDN